MLVAFAIAALIVVGCSPSEERAMSDLAATALPAPATTVRPISFEGAGCPCGQICTCAISVDGMLLPCPCEDGEDAGPPCKPKECSDYGPEACGKLDDGCGGTVVCNICPEGKICLSQESRCVTCSAPPDTPGESITAPFVTHGFDFPFGEAICKSLGRFPYLGPLLTAGHDKPKIKFSYTHGASYHSTGRKKCIEKTKGTTTDSFNVDICALSVSGTQNGSAETTTSYCTECVDGVGQCGSLMCSEESSSNSIRASVTRRFVEKVGLGDLILCPSGDSDCEKVVARLSQLSKLEVESGVTLSGAYTRRSKGQKPGSCQPCLECEEESSTIWPTLNGSLRLSLKTDLFKIGRWAKVSVGLKIGGFLGGGPEVTKTVKRGACGNDDCVGVAGTVQLGGFVEFTLVAFITEHSVTLTGRCVIKLGGEYCENSGVSPYWRLECLTNAASLFDIGAD
jgi:hypothetical protein